MSLKIAILASGSGSNAEAMFTKMRQGRLDIDVRLVISNRPNAKVLTRAKNFAIPTLELDHTKYESREKFDACMVQALKDSGAELIVLAGYMRILTPMFLQAFSNKVINIHPALLPSFPGVHGAQDACTYGVKVSGCTVHFVDEEMDHGSIIAQAVVPVLPQDDANALQQRIHSLEHRLYPQVIQWFAENRVHLVGRTVHIRPSVTQNTQGEDISASCSVEQGAYFIYPPLEAGF